jgi:hypothetical protein
MSLTVREPDQHSTVATVSRERWQVFDLDQPPARSVKAASPATRRLRQAGVPESCLFDAVALSEMPPQTVALAFAASIYPPAVAAVIALGQGAEVRSRVLAFVVAAISVTYLMGLLALFVLKDVGATGLHYTPSAAVDLALGVLLLGLAVRLGRPREPRVSKSGEGSRLERRLQSRRLAFVLGLTLYVLPSPIYLGAVKTIADAKLSTSGQLVALAVTLAVMLWLIELPMVLLLLVPGRASKVLEQVNAWFTEHGRRLAMLACVGAGAYLIAKGLVGLIG